MPGQNRGNQRNILLFEVGMVTPREGGKPLVRTVGVHPLVVVPSDIRYTDPTRSSVQQTYGGAVVNKAGRGLRTVGLSGTFGTHTRGFGPYVGTGENRFQRFWHEVVRLGDATLRDHVNDARDPVRSPFLNGALATFTEGDHFFVNFYDLWHGVQFEAQITNFSFNRGARQGGATGMTRYQLALQEVGPIVVGSTLTEGLDVLFQALTTWDTLNETIRSYTPAAFLTALAGVSGQVAVGLNDSIAAFNAQVDSVTSLMSGYAIPTQSITPVRTSVLADDSGFQGGTSENGTTTTMSHAERAEVVRRQALDLVEVAQAQAPAVLAFNAGGQIGWDTLAEDGVPAVFTQMDAIDDLQGLVDAALFQSAAGKFYGMSRDEYLAYITASGLGGRAPVVRATVEHLVQPNETAGSIERAYGVPFDEVLRLNDLLPAQALRQGTTLLIPTLRPVGPPNPIGALPTFDSHAGRSALGKGLRVDLVSVGGRLVRLEGSECLRQGMEWLVQARQESLLELANEVDPSVRGDLLARQLAQILQTDERILSVDEVAVTPGGDGSSLALAVQATAINGTTVRTG